MKTTPQLTKLQKLHSDPLVSRRYRINTENTEMTFIKQFKEITEVNVQIHHRLGQCRHSCHRCNCKNDTRCGNISAASIAADNDNQRRWQRKSHTAQRMLMLLSHGLKQKETWDTSKHTAEELIHLLTPTLINRDKQLHTEQTGWTQLFISHQQECLTVTRLI